MARDVFEEAEPCYKEQQGVRNSVMGERETRRGLPAEARKLICSHAASYEIHKRMRGREAGHKREFGARVLKIWRRFQR